MWSQFREISGQSDVFRYCLLIVVIGLMLLYFGLSDNAAQSTPPGSNTAGTTP